VGKQTQRPTEKIIEEIQQGLNADANYKRLFDRYSQQLYRFYLKKGLSTEDSRDLTQEAFISAFKGLSELRDPHKFRHWLFKIARNVYINNLEQRQAKKRDAREVSLDTTQDTSRLQNDDEWQITEAGSDPLNIVLEEEKRGELSDAVNDLPTQMRRCVYMKVMKGMSNSEIAEALGISPHTVKAHLQQAKKILKEKLRRHLSVLI
jgi:RNA polymerase sigma-70 factor (ECF subfamily)